MATVFKIESGSLKTNINWKPPKEIEMCMWMSSLSIGHKLSMRIEFIPNAFIGQLKFSYFSSIKYAIKLADDNC